MSRLFYGDVELEMIQTRQFSKTAEYDGTGSYVATRYVLEVTAVYNPAATSYTQNSSAEVIPNLGFSPAHTDASLKYYLLTPRRRLVFINGDEIALVSPELSEVEGRVYVCDARNGPTPISCDVKQISGEKTWLVTYKIETTLAECRSADSVIDGDDRDPMLSTAWTQSARVDPEHYTTITTTGLTTFRTDVLKAMNLTADSFRSKAIPGVPSGFQRVEINVQHDEVGRALQWRVVDKEQPYRLGGVNDYDRRKGIVSAKASAVLQTIPISAPNAPNLQVASAFVMGHLVVEAQGSPQAKRGDMLVWLLQVAASRFPIVAGRPQNFATTGIIRSVAVHENLHDKHMRLVMEVQLMPKAEGEQGLGPIGHVIRDYLGIDNNEYFNREECPQPAHDGNVRGPWIGQLYAQALKDGCKVPAMPTSIVSVNDYPYDNILGPPSIVVEPAPTEGQLPVSPNAYNQANQVAGAYVDYRVRSSHQTNENVIMAPGTGPASAPDVGPGPPDGPVGNPGYPTYNAQRVPGELGRADGGYDTGSYGSPVNTQKALTLSAPTTNVVVEWTAERVGSPPVIPSRKHADPNLVLVRSQVEPASVTIAADGVTPVFRVSGKYVYGALAPTGDTSTIFLGMVPYLQLQEPDLTLRPEHVGHGIIDRGDPYQPPAYGV